MGARNVLRLLQEALEQGMPFTLASGDTLKLLPVAADTGALNIGDGTTDMDVKIFLGSTTEFVLFDVGNSRVDYGADDQGVDVRFFGATASKLVEWDTSLDTWNFGQDGDGPDVVLFGDTASAKVTWDASADEIVFSGAASIRPKYEIVNKTADYTITTSDFGKIFTNRGDADAINFTLPAASGNAGEWVEFYSIADQNFTVTGQDEELVVLNDLTADSISFQTASEKIGGGFRAVCDGTSWIVVPLATETQTVTIASA